ncbi:aspartate/glutamate racemase family protein [Marinobacter nanhaiticus D15-8W]|uniref:Maleate cis-trans isomerase n=1 Tax=Marinobacter nanhaiticus D15-8W TaxID=626887 RepID=N6WMX4_9GAMM|nr:hypothetical protein [Marinobacter nanhaiticus]ENO12836.1 maleate cis-trans isomerase [Marinobacter nanhaiticus D15-8W]BES70185.1 aspartate/glutamate racemase family protein [Marinobacter nanhaiticus D15-8W]
MVDQALRRVGFLYPGHAAEDDYPWLGLALDPPVDPRVVHTGFLEDAHTVEALSEMGSTRRLADGARALAGSGIESVLWTSTSASFVLGVDGVRRQIATLEQALQVPASTTAMAFIHAIEALGAQRVAIAATFPEVVAQRFRAFLEVFGIEVVAHTSLGIVTAAEVGTLEKDAVVQLAARHGQPDADVLLVPDTALHSVAWLEDMEAAADQPVLTANQVSFWEALRLCGDLKPQSGLGRLFE